MNNHKDNNMKKAIFIILIFTAVAAFGQEFTFRGFPWGTTIEEIIAKEGEPDFINTYDNELKIVYDSKEMAGVMAEMALTFIANSLVRAEYAFILNNDESPRPINVFRSIEVNLKAFYGIPNSQNHYPFNTLFENTETWSFWWSIQRTSIVYSYFVTNDYFSHASVKYTSPAYNLFNEL